MAQYLEHLENYNNNLLKKEFHPIQKAYTTPHFLVFSFRTPGKTIYVYIGRGKQYVGVFCTEFPPPSFLRTKDRFLDFVRSNIVGAKISKIDLIDGVFTFYLKKGRELEKWSVFYEKRVLNFSYFKGDEVFCSWDLGLKHINEYQINPDSIESILYPQSILKYIENEEAKATGEVVLKKRLKFLLRKKEHIETDLHQSKKWQELQDLVIAEKLTLNDLELEVLGVKFSFTQSQSYWERQNLVYIKIKKLKRAEKLLAERLQDVIIEIDKIEKKEIEVKTTKERAIAINWNYLPKKESHKNKNLISSEVINFKYKNIVGVLGLTASANDQIRQESHKNHIWFHIENYPGTHLILKTENINFFKLDDFSILASMMRDYSKLNISTIPIMYSELRQVKGIKGKKGQVVVKKPKYLSCLYRDWKEIITIV